MVTANELLKKRCRHLDTGLSDAQIKEHLAAVDGWSLQDGKVAKTFSFANYYETLAFVNAIAYVIHAEDHHPELAVTYNRCVVKFDTHSVNGGRGGISENDFICAAKVDAVFHQRAA
ncbi:4a-hydroxytetrahydrobiopterin dehydratase [Noviherbaspirillum sp. UKPF54]|uniref:4a-hydroxytetrahydrobiopterin dehydratase n=1 Tax=Noviherbaspirillum sp. UKPF54 TaxID=2601898 RepID=UPI0011B1062C|nr:4a-hydroxytetrahydrobiopterin dehydratase [Noviherbaspirillum sp. UKPF54]QDZ28471.1 4a-hydroxytetrahydrobiopterin dehydratase [Noviherbaspirillum sp. UKPF54]